MPIPFEIAIGGPPVSQQARRRERVRQWADEVRAIAGGIWGSDPPVAETLSVTITYLFDSIRIDVDNIPKPILDALKSMVFTDDSQVIDLHCRTRHMTESLQVSNPPAALEEYMRQARPVVHVSVTYALEREVSSW